MSGSRYLLRRLMLSVLVILGVLLVTFMVSRVIPGDPARLYVGTRASEEALTEVRRQLGRRGCTAVRYRCFWRRLTRCPHELKVAGLLV